MIKVETPKISIILQGYSVNKESLNLIVDSYLRFGYTDIIVSSYSWCVDEEYLKNKVQLIFNDNFYHEKEPIFEKLVEHIEDERKRKNNKKRLNVNYQIQTTLAGINKSLEMFPENKYVIKQRCDMMLLNLDECIKVNLPHIKLLKDLPSKKFNYPFFTSIINRHPYNIDWYYSDWFYFTSIDNLKKLFDIPYTDLPASKPEEYIIRTYINSVQRKIPWEEFKDTYIIPWAQYPILYWYKTHGILSNNATYYPQKHKNLIPLS